MGGRQRSTDTDMSNAEYLLNFVVDFGMGILGLTPIAVYLHKRLPRKNNNNNRKEENK